MDLDLLLHQQILTNFPTLDWAGKSNPAPERWEKESLSKGANLQL